MECERFVGTGIASKAKGENCNPQVVHTKNKRKLSMRLTFSTKSSKRETLLNNEEDITLLVVTRSKFDDEEKGEINDILNDQDKSSTSTQVKDNFVNDKGQSYDFTNDEINQVIA